MSDSTDSNHSLHKAFCGIPPCGVTPKLDLSLESDQHSTCVGVCKKDVCVCVCARMCAHVCLCTITFLDSKCCSLIVQREEASGFGGVATITIVY